MIQKGDSAVSVLGEGEERGSKHTYKMRYNSRPTQWGNQKSVTLASTGENAERENVSCAAGRNAHLHIHFRKQFGKMSSSFKDEHLQP